MRVNQRKRNPTMTTATKTETRPETREIGPALRYELKNPRTHKLNGIVVYIVKSNSEPENEDRDHKVTFFDQRLQSCTCRGFRQWGHCYVSDNLVERERPAAEASELPYMPPLNGNRPFSLLR
jgi:hypothetical protein